MIVDTNVLVRALADQADPQAERARRRFVDARRAQVRLTVASSTVMEVAYVLGSSSAGYGWRRPAIADAVESLLEESALDVEHAAALRVAVAAYRARSIDLHDCLLDALATQRGTKVLSFDDDLRKLGHRELP